MCELNRFLIECNQRYIGCGICSKQCSNYHHCLNTGCAESYCKQCLAMIQRGRAAFTYNCKRITYHYALHFFYRFASEISNGMNFFTGSNNNRNLVVYSLGCGPGSEVFGIKHAILNKFPNFKLDYVGYDINNIWDDIQNLNILYTANNGHSVRFCCENMFAAETPHKDIDILVLNYLLSDFVKFFDDTKKYELISDLIYFIFSHNVKIILFNDIWHYGGKNGLDSGFQMMKCLIKKLKSLLTVRDFYLHYSGDGYSGSEPWITLNNNVLFQVDPSFSIQGITSCNSKTVICCLRR